MANTYFYVLKKLNFYLKEFRLINIWWSAILKSMKESTINNSKYIKNFHNFSKTVIQS